ncbi:P-loop containing nucleoside triphosphate hydrolase protein [Lentinula guzmanii]|uniref:P-loop containing nucleoside triphosphate hydrolase protein n=1 Tax=Lentinula guzmanii TaxID=2804957 RepID=A0AA38JE21_9AGAR|nr:P-loop containing nucleoside triphosphate hydrolase protein [Lentinula guzmanii]
MDTFRSLVQPLVGPSASSAGMIDGMKLVVLGGTVETARRMGSRAWNHFVNSFFLTAHFSEDDYPYDWLMLWLSRRPEWQRSREFETTTRLSTPLSGGSNSSSSRTADNSFGDEDYREWWNETTVGDGLGDDLPEVYNYDEDDVPGKVKTRVVFQPTFNTTHTIFYRGHWLRVRRWRKGDDMSGGGWGGSYGYNSGGGGEMLSVSVVARSNTILKQLVLQAKREYEAEAIHRIQIYFADSHGGWRWTDSRHKRPMSSIVLNPGVKEMLLNDTKDFLNSEKWYADRGIPFRRGYLLHGVPGSGKSSLIHAIAGELMLDIYALSLSAAWINDATLTTLMGRVPARCIVLLEDLDAAFTRSTGRRSKKDKKKDKKDKKDKKSKDKSKRRRIGASGLNGGANANDAMSDVNTLSLSGLLNALDGVAAAEGRLLFATTNHLDHLDPALSRPGRMDVWIDFKNASRWQAEALFRNFFPSCEDDINSRAPTPTPTSPSSLSLPSLRSSSSSPLQSHRNSRASSAGPTEHEHNDDGTLYSPMSPALRQIQATLKISSQEAQGRVQDQVQHLLVTDRGLVCLPCHHL